MSKTALPRRNTAAPENALTRAELDAFLGERREMRLATVRGDGRIHLTPVWYIWEDGKIHFLLQGERLHLRNLRRSPAATVLIDEDTRPREGWQGTARAAMFSGPVEIVDDPARTAPLRHRLLRRYVGDQEGTRVFESTGPETGRSFFLCVLSPDTTLTWNFAKQQS